MKNELFKNKVLTANERRLLTELKKPDFSTNLARRLGKGNAGIAIKIKSLKERGFLEEISESGKCVKYYQTTPDALDFLRTLAPIVENGGKNGEN